MHHDLQEEPESTLGSKPEELRRRKREAKSAEEPRRHHPQGEAEPEERKDRPANIDWYGADLLL